jgi:hypothetical protein
MNRASLATLLLIPVLAWGQTQVEANGIKMGEGRLHPFFTDELRYDSSAGFFGSNNTLQGELIDHIMPGLRLELPGSDFFLNVEGKLDYARYTGWLSPGSQSASRLQAMADLLTAWNRQGNVEMDFSDQFSRSDQTQNVAVGVGVISLHNEARAWVPIHPGGHALEVTPGIAYAVELFQTLSSIAAPGCTDPICNPTSVPSMNYQNIRPSLEGRWKFLPKTAIVVDTRLDFRSYINGGAFPSAQLLKVSAGLAGLVTPKIATVIKAGYSQDFATSNLKTLIGQLELQYVMSETAGVKVGAVRESQPVPIYGTYTDSRLFLEGRLLLAGRLNLHGVLSYDHLSFYSASGRADNLVTVDLAPEYQFANWLIGAVGYTVTGRSSNQNITSINYTRHEAYLRVTFTY